MKIRPFLAQWCPPALAQLARSLAERAAGHTNGVDQFRFEGQYSSWSEAAALSVGYSSPVIFEKTLAATLKVRSGEAAFERDSVTFERPDYPLFLISSLLRVAAVSGGRLSILDFGGALGSSYYQCRAFTAAVRDLRWAIVEQPHYVKFGQSELATDVLRFHGTIDDCARVEKPNVAVLSGVLSIVEKPYEIIDQITAHRIEHVIVDRQALVPSFAPEQERVCVETVPPYIYEGSYPFWLLSERKFRAAWAGNYDLVAEAELAPLATHVGQLPQRQLLFSRRA